MTTITTRAGKAAPLTNAELDDNFTNLNDDKQEILAEGAFVDGDKTKLDGIEASATADQTAGEIKTAYESNADTNAFTDAEQSKLSGIEASADVTDTANVTAAGALMDSEVANLAQVKSFDSADYATAAQGSLADSALQNVSEDTTPQLGGSLDTNGNDITFGDNDKAIFGAGSDLQIYHDGANSRILDNGTGFLAVGTNGADIRLTGQNFNEFMAKFEQDGPVTLYHNNVAKLATTATGIDVTGTVTADGLTVDGDATATNLALNSSFENWSVDGFAQIRRVGLAGGANAAGGNLTWNAYYDGGWKYIDSLNASRLQFSNNQFLFFTAPYGTADNSISFTETMRIDSSGNLLVGTTSSSIYNDTSGNGIQLNGASGQVVVAKQSTSSADPALWLNNTGVDGAIATFAKDGTTVGVIGAVGGDPYMTDGSVGYRIYNNNSIIPTNSSGGGNNNVVDLGGNGLAFKDLYLSGGVVFGSTGGSVTSKTLDDYEEGTWTGGVVATYDFIIGASPTITGSYQKIGAIVLVQFEINFDAATTPDINDRWRIDGLPFVIDVSLSAHMSSGVFTQPGSWATGTFTQGICMGGSSTSTDEIFGANVKIQGTPPNYNVTPLRGSLIYHTTA